MEKVIWLVITIPCSLLFTGIGIYAWRRTKPMWFWSGSSVREDEITNVKAYNRENGIMWFCYSAVFWISTIMGIQSASTAGIVLAGRMPGWSSASCYSLQQDLQKILAVRYL